MIVIVDGSTDRTTEALAQLQLPFPLRVIEQPNRGAAHARNRAAAEARNDVLLFLDDDMLAASDMIAEHARFYLEGADAVVGDALRDPGSTPGFMSDSNEAWLKRRSGPLTLFDVWTGQLSVRRTVFDGFFPQVPRDAEPMRGSRTGLHEMGLPYVSDPAITKHLAVFLKRNGYRPDQVQDFIPAPFDIATCMYHTGMDPFTKKPVHVERRRDEILYLIRPVAVAFKKHRQVDHGVQVTAGMAGDVIGHEILLGFAGFVGSFLEIGAAACRA